MPRSHPTSITLLAALTALLMPALAGAQAPPMPAVPSADAFVIRYYVTDEDGNRTRTMDSVDFTGFYNQARCECGQEVGTEVRLKVAQGTTYDINKQIQTFVGTMCATAQTNPLGMFRPCVLAFSSTSPTYTSGFTFNFHPVWLVNGVASISTANDLNSAIAAGSCASGQGEAGVWVCAESNGQNGCQSDEFIITGTQNANLPMGMTSGIKYDFLTPLAVPKNIKAIPGDEAVVVSWEVPSSDINGFRVLCEEVGTGKPPPGKGVDRPDLTDKQNGTLYFTKDNLCGGKPYSSFKGIEPDDPADDSTTTTDGTSTGDVTDGSSTDATGTGDSTDATGTDTDATGTASTGTTADTGAALDNCGDGTIDEADGEECDNSADNGPNGACHLDCKLDVCGDGQAGPEEQCDNGPDNAEANLCKPDCTLNASEGLTSLDWAYVCTGHLGLNTRSVRIEGLDNDKEYNFLLVGYDKAGNPVVSKELIRAAPVPTNDLWDQCKDQGNVCGESGFCNVAGRGDRMLGLAALVGLGLGVGGLVRRRRKNRA